jgi:hypothetical protein
MEKQEITFHIVEDNEDELIDEFNNNLVLNEKDKREEMIETVRKINEKFLKMPYYKNYAAASGLVHNVANHEDAVRDILISENLSKVVLKTGKSMILSWIEHPEQSTTMPINSFIEQPSGPNGNPDFIIKFCDGTILALECKTTKPKNAPPVYNSGGVSSNYYYVFSNEERNETVTYMGYCIRTEEQQTAIDNYIVEARLRDEIFNEKLKSLDINGRGISWYTRPMIHQQGGEKYSNYFTHENKDRDTQSVIEYVTKLSLKSK